MVAYAELATLWVIRHSDSLFTDKQVLANVNQEVTFLICYRMYR